MSIAYHSSAAGLLGAPSTRHNSPHHEGMIGDERVVGDHGGSNRGYSNSSGPTTSTTSQHLSTRVTTTTTTTTTTTMEKLPTQPGNLKACDSLCLQEESHSHDQNNSEAEPTFPRRLSNRRPSFGLCSMASSANDNTVGISEQGPATPHPGNNVDETNEMRNNKTSVTRSQQKKHQESARAEEDIQAKRRGRRIVSKIPSRAYGGRFDHCIDNDREVRPGAEAVSNCEMTTTASIYRKKMQSSDDDDPLNVDLRVKRNRKKSLGNGIRRKSIVRVGGDSETTASTTNHSRQVEEEIEAKRRGQGFGAKRFMSIASHQTTTTEEDDEVNLKRRGVFLKRNGVVARQRASTVRASYNSSEDEDDLLRRAKNRGIRGISRVSMARRTPSLAITDSEDEQPSSDVQGPVSVSSARDPRGVAAIPSDLESAGTNASGTTSSNRKLGRLKLGDLEPDSLDEGKKRAAVPASEGRDKIRFSLGSGCGGSISPCLEEFVDEEGCMLPGAIAVFGAEGYDDDETEDFINPDNFQNRNRRSEANEDDIESANDQYAHHRLLRPTQSRLPTRIQSVQHQAETRRAHAESHLGAGGNPTSRILPHQAANMKRNCVNVCPMIACVFLLAMISLGVYIGLRENSLNEGVAISSLSPTSQPSLEPSISPSQEPSRAATLSLQPSFRPTIAPTSLPWMLKEQINQDGIGTTVNIVDTLLVTSSGGIVQTYQNVDDTWNISNQTFDGEEIVLSNTKYLAVRRGRSVSVFESDDVDGWKQIGTTISIEDFVPVSIALAKNSPVLAIGGMDGVFARVRVFDFESDDWVQRKSDFVEVQTTRINIEVGLDASGRLLGVGLMDGVFGIVKVVEQQSRESGWESAIKGVSFLQGGPQFVFSENTVVCGSVGVVQVYSIISGEQIGQDISLSSFTMPLLSTSQDGNIVAITFADQLLITQLVENRVWRPKGEIVSSVLTEGGSPFTSIDVSSDASLVVVGQSSENTVYILEQVDAKS